MIEKIKTLFQKVKFGRRQYYKNSHNPNYIKWFNTEPEKLKLFNNLHKGEDCIIIGNGPSLNKMDLSAIKSYYTIGLNKIHLFKKFDLNLSYLVSVNEFVIEQAKDDFEVRDIPVFLSLKNAKNIQFKNKKIHKINALSSFGFGTEMEGDFFEGGTVTHVALQIAFAMGFQRVALIGIDHNFTQDGQGHDAQKMSGDDVNHFDPNYFKGQMWHLADLRSNEIAYQIDDYEYNLAGRKIYDATLNGKLDVFEKKDFEFILENFKKK